jgi:hypothetical protein
MALPKGEQFASGGGRTHNLWRSGGHRFYEGEPSNSRKFFSPNLRLILQHGLVDKCDDGDRSRLADIASDITSGMPEITNPKVFISYSWSSEEHKEKILKWAQD